MVKTTIIIGLLYLLLAIFNPADASNSVGGQSASLSSLPRGTSRSSVHKSRQNYTLKKLVIRKVLSLHKSPLEDSTGSFIDTCEKYEFDCYLLPSITGLESSFGMYTHPGSHNPFGWGGGYILFSDWGEGIEAVGKGLRENYMNRGAETIEQIGPIYAESPTWAVRVRFFHSKFLEEERKQQLYFSRNHVEL